jgi:hypothetical protein
MQTSDHMPNYSGASAESLTWHFLNVDGRFQQQSDINQICGSGKAAPSDDKFDQLPHRMQSLVNRNALRVSSPCKQALNQNPVTLFATSGGSSSHAVLVQS